MYFADDKKFFTFQEALLAGYTLVTPENKFVRIAVGDADYYEVIGIITEYTGGFLRYFGDEYD